MKHIVKVLLSVVIGSLYAMHGYAQWTEQDSLRLKKMLESPDEIELNKEAIRSIDLNANPLPENPSVYKDYLRYNTTMPELPDRSISDSLPKRGMSLMPYNGTTKYNYDPISGKRILFGTEIKRNGINSLPTVGGRKVMEGTRLMLMGGGFGADFKYDLGRLFEREFWDFRSRRAAKKTLLALENYVNPEESQGRYEYYYLDESDFSVSFTGSSEAEEKIQSKLKEYEPMKKGLLYFKYTADGSGNFTLYLPDDQYVKGTFTRNWLGYRLTYNGMELAVSFSQIGGRYYKLNLNLTREFKELFATDSIEKVMLVTTASRISSGSDRRN